MHPRTEQLNKLMRDYSVTASEVGELINRKTHTVNVWRGCTKDRIIPDHTLEVLRIRLAERAVKA
ncbi:transcriptional repressor [Xanthomonas phage FoX5]|uniref:DNA-binding protein n=2 Tax=Foxunavirus TaxID=2948712 RepID=A0A858NNX8_9CAUD|nr:transcriptional repressor [Xanthomonas phage FoX1]YP_010106916.1 transcriptional repressor [Xanthomonas phage FoX5]QWY14274.1 repressor protein [Xanthomonas phage M29]WNL50885.1 putative transcriptional repressor [Xanthomonas phage Murka]QJB21788.1 hypothetical protein XccvBFoX1_gp49 [Xanthomonas phage FoX1]QJB22029.1 hypothetical protein XccvBFoX5_gp51 [Xanthomonas phage FoX5]